MVDYDLEHQKIINCQYREHYSIFFSMVEYVCEWYPERPRGGIQKESAEGTQVESEGGPRSLREESSGRGPRSAFTRSLRNKLI